MRIAVILVALITLAGCSEKELRQAYESVSAELEQKPLTRSEVTRALKDSLARGIASGARQAARKNGYYGSPELKIEFPRDLRKVEKALRRAGFDKDVDRFVKQLNRSAELAAAQAKPIFVKAIKAMTIEDAFGILNGPPDAATRYLRRSAGPELRLAFMPIVSDKLEQTSATRYFGKIVDNYNQLPLVSQVDSDLAGYATDRAIDGLFVLIAREEAEIRANPKARVTELLRRVFGSLD